MQRNLFGVPIPPGAVRVSVRPSIGRGGVLPLWEGRLDEGEPPSDSDILIQGSRNAGFWEYLDAQIRSGRLKREEVYEWKLRLCFVDQNHAEESITTPQAFECYRSTASGTSADPHAQILALHQSGMELVREALRASSECVKEATKAAAAAIADVSKSAAAALAEASKQTSTVSEMAKALHEECGELKKGIFELQTARAQAVQQPTKSTAGELKELLETGKTLFSLADGMLGKPDGDKPGGSN